MSGLSEVELHVQAMRLVCEALADREQQGIEVDWDVIRQMHDQMDAMLQDLWHKHRYYSSEMVDLRKDRDAARANVESLQQRLTEAQQERVDAIDDYEGQIAAAEALIDPEANGETTIAGMADMILHMRQQLDAANAAWNLQCAGIERLQAFVGKVRAAQNNYQWPASWNEITAALAELDAEPTPVTEPLDAEGGA